MIWKPAIFMDRKFKLQARATLLRVWGRLLSILHSVQRVRRVESRGVGWTPCRIEQILNQRYPDFLIELGQQEIAFRKNDRLKAPVARLAANGAFDLRGHDDGGAKEPAPTANLNSSRPGRSRNSSSCRMH